MDVYIKKINYLYESEIFEKYVSKSQLSGYVRKKKSQISMYEIKLYSGTLSSGFIQNNYIIL